MSIRSNDEGEPIAVVGLGCRFPGAPGPRGLLVASRARRRGRGPVAGGAPGRERRGQGAGRIPRGRRSVRRAILRDLAARGGAPRPAAAAAARGRVGGARGRGARRRERLDGSATGVFVGMWINDYEARMFAETGRRRLPHDHRQRPLHRVRPPVVPARPARAERDGRHRVLLVARGRAPGVSEPLERRERARARGRRERDPPAAHHRRLLAGRHACRRTAAASSATRRATATCAAKAPASWCSSRSRAPAPTAIRSTR